MPIVIAVDGDAGSGKGTLSRRLSSHFGYEYLDTGKIYRAVAHKYISQNATTEEEAIEIAKNIRIEDTQIAGLATEEVGKVASQISAIGELREALIDFQRKIANSPNGAVLDGRDIGTVICPNADYKFYITADLEVRANRRYRELSAAGKDVTEAGVLADMKARDERDKSRVNAPLVIADDAVYIDTTKLSIDDVFNEILSRLTEK